MSAHVVRLCLIGVGHVGSSFLELIAERHTEISERYGYDLRLVGAAEKGAGAWLSDGLNPGSVLDALRAGHSLGALDHGKAGATAEEVLHQSSPDILLCATPVDHETGSPGLQLTRQALSMGYHVVLADKGPMVLAYSELYGLSDLGSASLGTPCLRFSATVAGALPVVNIGVRDLAGLHVRLIEGVFNGTSHSILRAMGGGVSLEAALAEASARGIVEEDSSLDIDGFDSAFKLLIAANTVLGASAKLDDVVVTGIRGVTLEQIHRAEANGDRLVPLATAERVPSGIRLTTGPAVLPQEHPLARLHPDEMGVVFYAEGVDRLFAASLEPGPKPAAAAMLRDVLDIMSCSRGSEWL